MFILEGLSEETLAAVARLRRLGYEPDVHAPGAQGRVMRDGGDLPAPQAGDPTTYRVAFLDASGRTRAQGKDEDYAVAVERALMDAAARSL